MLCLVNNDNQPKTNDMKTSITINGVRFLKHGLKDPAGKYYPAMVYRSSKAHITGSDTITIYAKTYDRGLPVELNPDNDTDSSTDYFERDSVTYLQGTPQFDLLAAIAR